MSNASKKYGKLILILGPSGCGKGTIIKYIKKKYPSFIFPISYTTRNKRKNEKEGEVYHFISQPDFKEKIKNDELLEWAIVHQDNYYGTSKLEILKNLEKGKIVLREVDIQGAESIKKLVPKENLSIIFITTNSWNDLKDRIINRNTISSDELEKRHKSYIEESKYKSKADYIIHSINGDIPANNQQADEIITQIIKS